MIDPDRMRCGLRGDERMYEADGSFVKRLVGVAWATDRR